MFYTSQNQSAGLTYVNNPKDEIICRVMDYDYRTPEEAQEFADNLVELLNCLQNVKDEYSSHNLNNTFPREMLMEKFNNLLTN